MDVGVPLVLRLKSSNRISRSPRLLPWHARRHLDKRGRRDVTLIITGGLRTESDFVKALALGPDGIAVSNAARQAIGCLGMRACYSNNCPVGIATQKPHLPTRRLIVRK